MLQALRCFRARVGSGELNPLHQIGVTVSPRARGVGLNLLEHYAPVDGFSARAWAWVARGDCVVAFKATATGRRAVARKLASVPPGLSQYRKAV